MFETFSDVDERVAFPAKVRIMPTIAISSEHAPTVDVDMEMMMVDHVVEGITFLPRKPKPDVSLVGFHDHPDLAHDKALMTSRQYRKRAMVKCKKCIELLNGKMDMLNRRIRGKARSVAGVLQFCIQSRDG